MKPTKPQPRKPFSPDEQSEIEAALNDARVRRLPLGDQIYGSGRRLPPRAWWRGKNMVGAGRARQKIG